jgi:K+-sensing histidine kinase KdpD
LAQFSSHSYSIEYFRFPLETKGIIFSSVSRSFASVILGGTGPGLLATALSALASSYFFLEPVGSFKIQSPQAVERLLLFLLEGAALIVVGRLLRSTPPKEPASALFAIVRHCCSWVSQWR